VLPGSRRSFTLEGITLKNRRIQQKSKDQDQEDEQDPKFRRYTLGNGQSFEAPLQTVQNIGRLLTEPKEVQVVDLRKMNPCARCGGHPDERGGPVGGFLTRLIYDSHWYEYADACPDCIYGEYRHTHLKTPFYVQLDDLREDEIRLLRNAMQADDKNPPFRCKRPRPRSRFRGSASG
jgi:hypothetical protein